MIFSAASPVSFGLGVALGSTMQGWYPGCTPPVGTTGPVWRAQGLQWVCPLGRRSKGCRPEAFCTELVVPTAQFFFSNLNQMYHQVFAVSAQSSSPGRWQAWLGSGPSYGPGPDWLVVRTSPIP